METQLNKTTATQLNNLVVEYQNNPTEPIFNQIYANITKIIAYHANNYSNNDADKEDYHAVGMEAVIKAIPKYDITKGFNFSTLAVRYATTAMNHYYQRYSSTMKKSDNGKYYPLKKEGGFLFETLGAEENSEILVDNALTIIAEQIVTEYEKTIRNPIDRVIYIEVMKLTFEIQSFKIYNKDRLNNAYNHKNDFLEKFGIDKKIYKQVINNLARTRKKFLKNFKIENYF